MTADKYEIVRTTAAASQLISLEEFERVGRDVSNMLADYGIANMISVEDIAACAINAARTFLENAHSQEEVREVFLDAAEHGHIHFGLRDQSTEVE